jgi:hypothetical protein
VDYVEKAYVDLRISLDNSQLRNSPVIGQWFENRMIPAHKYIPQPPMDPTRKPKV